MAPSAEQADDAWVTLCRTLGCLSVPLASAAACTGWMILWADATGDLGRAPVLWLGLDAVRASRLGLLLGITSASAGTVLALAPNTPAGRRGVRWALGLAVFVIAAMLAPVLA